MNEWYFTVGVYDDYSGLVKLYLNGIELDYNYNDPPTNIAERDLYIGSWQGERLFSGMIDDGLAVFIERVVEETSDAEAVIFVVDTFGGRVDSAIKISNTIIDSKSKTIAFVDGNGAISAGALISLSCDEIIMKPETAIGAATPIMMTLPTLTTR